MEKVVLGLSGGVDSSLCAVLLREQGYDVEGLFLSYKGADPEPARQAAAQAKIPLTVLDITEELETKVIRPFCEAYRDGITPIPCVLCNPEVKFKAIFDHADRVGARYVATGHYARVGKASPSGGSTCEAGDRGILSSERSAPEDPFRPCGAPPPDGEACGIWAIDNPKDQSYMLHRLPPQWIPRLIFPLGDFPTKDAVRAAAAQRGLSAAASADSMEVCFIPEDDHAAFLESRGFGCPGGDFVDESGKVLGRHGGIHRYTVGQRRGLGVAASGRLFVKGLDPVHNRVVLTLQDPQATELCCRDVVWQQTPETRRFPALVKIRYSRTSYPAVVEKLMDGRAKVEFRTPARAPAPGQSAVFYREDGLVIGGGIIC